MDDDLEQLLINLKLKKLRALLPATLARAEQEGWSYTELLKRVLREEYQDREMRYLGHRIRRAKLPEPWTLESFPWDRQPAVTRAVIEELALLSFLDRASNIVFIGPTGTGKTGLSIGLLRKGTRTADHVLRDRLRTTQIVAVSGGRDGVQSVAEPMGSPGQGLRRVGRDAG